MLDDVDAKKHLKTLVYLRNLQQKELIFIKRLLVWNADKTHGTLGYARDEQHARMPGEFKDRMLTKTDVGYQVMRWHNCMTSEPQLL